MKHKWILFFTIITFAFLTSCSKEPDPDQQFQQYINSWQKQDFKQMYQSLSESSKKSISKKDFVNRYTAIYDGIQANHFKVTFKKPKEKVKPNKNGKITFSYQVKMDTIGGPIQFTHKATLMEEKQDGKNNWVINWNPSLIFPQLKSNGDKIRVSTEEPIRGEILDRNGNPLAENGTVTQIGIVPGQLGDDQTQVKETLAKALGTTVSEINQKLNASWVKPDYFVPIKSVQNDETSKITRLLKLQGVTKEEVNARVYPYKDVFAHLIGYVGSITADELKTLKSKGYTSTDIVGKRGLEQLYDQQLHGVAGGSVYVVDKNGNKVDTLAKRPAKNGENIKLTVDVKTQMALYRELKGDAGTAVALDPKTGEILGLVSAPAFDPNDFIIGVSDKEWQALNQNKQKPLTNRFEAAFSPGSTFKAVTASIALDNGVLKPNDTKTIKSLKWQKDSSWGNYYVKRVSNITTPMTLQGALVYSDNIFFAQTALKIGASPFIEGAKKFGIGEPLPIDYPFETSKISNNGKINNDIQLADSGYGQGEVSMNPVQLALIYSAFVNQGNVMKPLLLANDSPSVWKKNAVSPKNAQVILNDLKQVVASPNGTAHTAYMPNLPLAGKTGTAELKEKQGTNGKEYGWFVALNTDHPNLVVTMMVENVQNKGGSHYLVPKVKNIFTTLEK